jgi:hypothetical protein
MAQNDGYTFSAETQPYQSLENPIYLTDNPVDLQRDYYMVSGDFWFELAGKKRYSFAVNSRGLLPTQEEAIRLSGWFMMHSNSSIAYEVVGNSACKQRILKIEYKNIGLSCGNNSYDSFYLDYQIWLYESSNIIELHIGKSQINSSNCNGNVSFRGFLWDTNTQQGGAFYYNGTLKYQNNALNTNPDLYGRVPLQNTVWRFTPAKPVLDEIKVFPTAFTQSITFQKTVDCGEWDVQIFDLAGKKLLEVSLQGKEVVVNTNQIPFGMYILRITDQTTQKRTTQRIFSLN